MLKLNILFILSITFSHSHGSVSMHNPFYCFAMDPVRPQNQMFASKVAYEAVRGNGFVNPAISSNLFIVCLFLQWSRLTKHFSMYTKEVLYVWQTWK